MIERLRILHLEDEPDFSGLVKETLRADDVQADVTLASTRTEFEAVCQPDKFDLILADYSLPDYTGALALEHARNVCPQTPFILLSGTIGEAAAVESLRAGATDYVLKQWPERLVPAIRRAIDESRERARRLRAEEEMRQREAQYRFLFSGAPDPMWVLDAESLQFLEVNEAAVRDYGYPREQFLTMKATDIRPAEDVPAFRAFVNHASIEKPSEGMGGAGVWRHQRKDGSVFIAELKFAVIQFHGRPALLTLAQDVTYRLRAEQRDSALAKLGRQLNSATTQLEAARIIEGIADELFGWDAFSLCLFQNDGRLVNQVLMIDTICGRRVELPGTDAETHASPRARRTMEAGAELILREANPPMPTDTYMFGDRSRPSVSLMYVPLRSGSRTIGVLSVQSYTVQAYDRGQLDLLQILADHCGGALERIRVEQSSREMEQRFRELFDRSPDAIFVESEEGMVLDANEAACRLNGLPRGQLVGKHVTDLVPPEHRGRVMDDFRTLVSGERSAVEGESRSADGRVIPVEIRTSRTNFAGQPALLLHVRDISERKQAESALRSSELLFCSVWENSVDGMRLTNEEGRIVAVNDAFCRLVHGDHANIEGRLFTEVFSDKGETPETLASYQVRFRDRALFSQPERRVVLADGTPAVFEESNSFVELRGQPTLLLTLFRDVTIQRRLEEQLRQSQKMEAIGQLAGGVAHDFNNILTVIHGHASMLGMGGSLNGPASRSAQQIVQAAERAAGLTRQLLAFSRRQVMQTRQLDLNEVVASITKMLARILGEDVALRVNYCPQTPMVQADQSMVEQVLLNLAINARDAMPKGGELTVSISVEALAEPAPTRFSDARAGRFVCLSVADTGCGIAMENLERIFEPFFTTKAKGKGTGLGLATVYGVVKQHQGWVDVQSQVGKGTAFRVFIPLVSSALPSGSNEDQTLPSSGGTETILLVEDEDPVREMVRMFLSAQGYQVIEAESGAKALELWASLSNEVDLLLTDLVMPGGVNGRELADILRGQQPKLKVIYMSGYSADILGKEFVVRPGFNFLQKPYHPNRLASAVRESLDTAIN